MTPGDKPQVACTEIDDETIERYVMGRLEDGPTKQHIEACAFCLARVDEHRAYLDDLKRGLREL